MDGEEQDKRTKLEKDKLILDEADFASELFYGNCQCTTRNVSIPDLIFSCADIHFKGTKAELMWKDPDTRSQTVTTAGTFSLYICMYIYSHKQS